MDDATVSDRNDRFEMISACPEGTLVEHAEAVLESPATVEVLQAPTPQLVMQRVTEPVDEQPFNLGEVLTTAAEARVADAKGFAMVAGKAEAKAVAGAIVDAAVAAEHPRSAAIATDLEAAADDYRQRRRREWAESKATTVEFSSMEGEE